MTTIISKLILTNNIGRLCILKSHDIIYSIYNFNITVPIWKRSSYRCFSVSESKSIQELKP